jgi:PIN domain nuclease of toxin-antitoxin system
MPDALLLDTNALLFALADSPRLSLRARRTLQDASVRYVSAVSFWEISIKAQLDRPDFPKDVIPLLEDARTFGFDILDISPETAIRAGSLPLIHRDPFDRLLVAQALSLDVPIMSSDRKLRDYPARLIPT